MDLEKIMNETDVDKTYDMFLDVFTQMYDTHCLLKEINVTKGNKEGKPWFTNGLRNACKKNNTLYKNFLRSGTQSAQVKYKTYKNKLTTILRISEKQYYNKLLVQEKNNMKGTWAILNTIIKKGHQAPSYPQEIMGQL